MVLNVLQRRKKLGYSQSKIAEMAGITRQMISAIERGSTPSLKTAQKLAKIYNCTIDELLCSNPIDNYKEGKAMKDGMSKVEFIDALENILSCMEFFQREDKKYVFLLARDELRVISHFAYIHGILDDFEYERYFKNHVITMEDFVLE